MSNSQSFIFQRILSKEIFLQLQNLWQQMAQTAGEEALLFTEKNLTKSKSDRELFQVLITPNFSALCLGQPQKEPQYLLVNISFDPKIITVFIQEQMHKISRRFPQKKQLEKTYTKLQDESNGDELAQSFIFNMLDILTKTEGDLLTNTYPHFSNHQAVQEVLHNQLEQQRILDRVKTQISQNSDLLEIVTMTIQQVQILLEVDRLVIYQLDVPLKKVDDAQKIQLIDTVTYEARNSQEITSILYFQDEICFSESNHCRNKYRQGFSLAIKDIRQEGNLPVCLQLLMERLQVRAKLVTPIVVQNKLWGFVIAHQCFTPRNWRKNEIDFLCQIAEYLAIAIYQAESYQQLQQQKKLLEEQVKTRAQQLQDALIAAQIASQSKSEFLDNMSHELRTPLTCVIGLSGTLLHWSLAQGNQPLSLEKQRQYLKTIQDSGRHLLELVNNILQFSEVESGKHLLNLTEVSLYNLTRNVCQSFQEDADKKNISLQLDFQVDFQEDKFLADPKRVKQILSNLLHNGIKFTPENGTVILRTWREKETVILEIEDSGIGIAPEQISLLFNRFQQLEKSRERTYGGAGLSLALTKQLVELHGGTIKVESILGKGSTFTVCFPDKEKNKFKFAKDLSTNNFLAKNKTIVLLEQDEEVATLICELLTAADYQVIWLIDGETAVRQIELLQPILVIIDKKFTEISLAKFSNTIKQLPRKKYSKILVTSFQITAEDWQNLVEYGVDDYLIKPFQASDLLQKINLLSR